MWWSSCYRKTVILEGVHFLVPAVLQKPWWWALPGIVLLQSKFTLAFIKLLLKSTGVSHQLPPKFGQAICLRGKGGPWEWQAENGTWLSLQSGVSQSRAGMRACLKTAELVLWAQRFLFWDFKVSSFSLVPSIAQGDRLYPAGGGFGVQGKGLRSDRCWGCSSQGFWSSWLGVLDSSQP